MWGLTGRFRDGRIWPVPVRPTIGTREAITDVSPGRRVPRGHRRPGIFTTSKRQGEGVWVRLLDMTSARRLVFPVLLMSAGFLGFSPAAGRSLQAAPDSQARSSQATQEDARSYLQGRWSLASFEVHPPGQTAILAKGTGQLTYDAQGNLKMQITAEPASVPLLEKAGIVLQKDAKGFGVILTEGRAIVDLAARTLTYEVKGAPVNGVPGPLSLARPRHYQVQGTNLLTLTTRDENGRPLAIATWRKEL